MRIWLDMNKKKPSPETPETAKKHKDKAKELNQKNDEYGGQNGPDPTRYGDWEKDGRCTDF